MKNSSKYGIFCQVENKLMMQSKCRVVKCALVLVYLRFLFLILFK